MNNEFKINNNIVFEDEETKVEYQKYLDEINEYNRKVANGEKPESDLSEIMSKFKEKFDVEGAENKKIESYDINGLINKIDNGLKSMDSSYDPQNIDKTMENIDKRLEQLNMEDKFYKKNNEDTIWWVDNHDEIGKHEFSFDKKKIYNLFQDYPYNLTKEEKEIFDKENPYWKEFFKDRV